jgi:hypothetical protein
MEQLLSCSNARQTSSSLSRGRQFSIASTSWSANALGPKVFVGFNPFYIQPDAAPEWEVRILGRRGRAPTETFPLEGLVRGHHRAVGNQYYVSQKTMPPDNNFSQNLPKTNQINKTNSEDAVIP